MMTSIAVPFSVEDARTVPAARVGRRGAISAYTLLQTATLGVLITCLTIGILGLRIPYPRAHVPIDRPPVTAQRVAAKLLPPPPPQVFGPVIPEAPPLVESREAEPPPPEELTATPQAAPLIAVA